ncbi:MAG: cadmium-translocating P-type ATPase [Alphaproteobacteria bacterium]|nr:cadmium-translocating P-type ATPase [Alphaproteobacteria bacterium]
MPAGGGQFCCAGCEAAFATIQGLGLGRYYRQRVLDRQARAPRPEAHAPRDFSRYVTTDAAGNATLTLAVDGLQCGACVWLIESVLAQEPDLLLGRVNLTTRRLRLVWRGGAARAEALVARAEALGYRLMPFDPALLAAARDRTGRALIRALAVAGFAAGNVMLMSAATWFGLTQGMGPATRALMHWVSALIALPAIAYAGMPFFRSAFAALRQRRTNMDVPISVGVILVSAMSLVESFRGGLHTYFDSAITLLFFLLLGRVLDHQARGQARATAEHLLTLRAADVAVLQPDGGTRRVAHDAVAPAARVLVGMGERVGVDGVVEDGHSTLDASLVTGESVPAAVAPGAAVFAGTLNLGPALIVRATATGARTLLAECVRLIEAAEARRGRFVVLADRVARRYAPAVHILAAATFVFWWVVMGAGVADSLLTAAAVLIITCPCALALAVPAVQVLATSRLLRAGILVKSATALERLAQVDTIVFDKTGTLTEPMPTPLAEADADAWRTAASLAAASRHPLARALHAAMPDVPAARGAEEHPGRGIALAVAGGTVRLGSRAFCDLPAAPAATTELWLARPGRAPVRFGFEERLREDAAQVVAGLRALGLAVVLASGDQAVPVRRIAALLGITDVHAACTPADKVALIERLRGGGRHVLMAGDGLNDGPSLAAAHVSVSPATAADISQTVADVVFQGARLAPVVEVLRLARRARSAMRQNLALAIGYNALMVPLAAAGLVTPWLAAIAMSSSSLLVLGNSFRLQGRARRWT